MRQSLLLILLFKLFTATARADMGEAIKFFNDGQYDSARQALEALPENQKQDATYFYNLGNVYFKLQNFGKAVAYYSKSARLKPHDAATQRNLALAQKALQNQSASGSLDPASNPLQVFADQMTPEELYAFLGLIVLFAISLSFKPYMKNRNFIKTIFRPSGIATLIILFFAFILFLTTQSVTKTPPAVFTEKTIIRSGPKEDYAELGRMEAGVKIRVLKTEETASKERWIQIEYGPDAVGWVPSSSLLLL